MAIAVEDDSIPKITFEACQVLFEVVLRSVVTRNTKVACLRKRCNHDDVLTSYDETGSVLHSNVFITFIIY